MKTPLLTLFLILSAAFAPAESGNLSSALERGLIAEEVNRDFDAAIAAYESAVARFDQERELAATAMFRLAENYRRAGRTEEAAILYERIVREFHDRDELARLAAERLPEERVAAAGTAAISPEFSPVTIQVQTEEGRPLAGFRVEMESGEGRRVFASGESDETGVALSRNMPYGDYNIKLSEPTGWTLRLRVTVEVGAPLEKVVNAPDPAKRASVRFRAKIAEEAFAGLKFGEVRNVWSLPPEVRAQLRETSPEIGDGIDDAGIEIWFSPGQKRILQPDGVLRLWSNGKSTRMVFATPEGILVIEDRDQILGVRPGENARFFAPDRIAQSLILHELPLEGKAGAEAEVDLPAGNVRVWVRGILGRANEEVLASLGLEADNRDVWLDGVLGRPYEWAARFLYLEGGEPIRDGSVLAGQTLILAPGETAEVVLKSPAKRD